DRRGDRLGQVGMDVEGGDATLDAAVEDEQRALGRDRGLFRELDRDNGLTGADDRWLAGFFRCGGVGRLQLTAGAGRKAFDVDRCVFRFEQDFFQWRRLRFVGVEAADAPRRGEGDRRVFGFRKALPR